MLETEIQTSIWKECKKCKKKMLMSKECMCSDCERN